jgi:hypothetical protein
MKKLVTYLAAFALIAFGGKALADLSVLDSTSATKTIFNFACFTTKLCNATTLIDNAGTEVGTAAAPLQVSLANTGANATAAKVNVASGGIASGAIASGAIASGAVASGALASGSVASGAIVDLGAQADTVCATDTGTCTLIALLKKLNSNAAAAIPAGTATIGTVGQLPYPVGAVPYTATATGTTGATTATLAGASSVTTYLCGFSIRANATAAATNNATVTGVITATLNFTQWTAPLASGLGVTEQIFSPCIPASGTNQSIAVVSGAPGSGGVVSVTAWGYKL